MTAFILSLWSALLSASAMGGQLYLGFSEKSMPPVNVEFAHEMASEPRLAATIAVALFYLPIFISSFLVFRHIKRTGRAEPLIFTSLTFNTFSLMYGLFLYGLLAR